MNQDEAAGKWMQFKGKIKEQWGKLTDDDLKKLEGNRDQLAAGCRSATGSPRKRQSARSVTSRTNIRICTSNPDQPGRASTTFAPLALLT